MTDKKTSATAASATKKASAATKKPVTVTPAAPKTEVKFFFFDYSYIYHKKITRKQI
jgi:hypothetical protein